MKQMSSILSVLTLLAFVICTPQQESLEMKKLELRQRLDDTLLEIDQQIENVVLDTARLAPGEYEDQLVQYKHQLESLRDSVLHKIERVENVSASQWPAFTEQVDSTEVHVKQVLEQIRDELQTLTQRYTLPS